MDEPEPEPEQPPLGPGGTDVTAAAGSNTPSLDQSLEDEDHSMAVEQRARTATNLALLDAVDALRHADEQRHLAKSLRRQESWREHQEAPHNAQTWRGAAALALDAEETQRQAEERAAKREQQANDDAAKQEAHRAHSRLMAAQLATTAQQLAEVSVHLEQKIAGQRRRCASGDPGCLCLRLPPQSGTVGRTDLRMWLDAHLDKQRRQLKVCRGSGSKDSKASASLLVRRDIPRTECAIRSLVDRCARVGKSRLFRLAAPDAQRVSSATAKTAAIADEQARRVGGFAPSRRRPASARQQGRAPAAAAQPASARHHKPHQPKPPAQRPQSARGSGRRLKKKKKNKKKAAGRRAAQLPKAALPTVLTDVEFGPEGQITVESTIRISPELQATGGRVGVIIGGANSFNLEIQLHGEVELWWDGGELDIWGTSDLRDGAEHTVGFTRTHEKVEVTVDGVV